MADTQPDDPSRAMQLFFEMMERMPRQGPGHRACTARALALCEALPQHPRVLDLGCGTGASTLDLANMTGGSIVAVDLHAPSIGRLRAAISERGLAGRVSAEAADFTDLPFDPERFDLVWSEGALYNLGMERAMAVCRRMLRPGGYLAFTDAVWRSENPPKEARALFAEEYPTMGRVEDVAGHIAAAGFALLGHFPLPDEAWWEGFYTPMERCIEAMRRQYHDDPRALSALDELAAEPESHRRLGEHYGYEFFVCRKPE